MEKIKINELEDAIGEKWDFFICSASYEQRSLTIPLKLKNKNIDSILVCHNAEHLNNIENTKILLDTFNKKSKEVKISSKISIKTADEILKALNYDKTHPQKIIIDITTFTHESLLILLMIFKNILGPKDELKLLYNNANDYSFNEKNPEEKWLSRGVGRIRPVLGYSGILDPLQKNHLIILFGFESERTKSLIETIEANKISLGFASKDESFLENHYELNKKRHEELLNIYSDSDTFEFSSTDPIKTKSILKKIIENNNIYNSIIAPMNTKISTIGVASFALENPNVQVCYVPALIYNDASYAIPGEYCYIIDSKESDLNIIK